MAVLTPPTFVTATPPTAAALNSTLDELDKLNGDLGDENLVGGFLMSKRMLRRGALTRSDAVSCTAIQRFTVGAAGTGSDVITGETLFIAGCVIGADLPAGDWDCVVNYSADLGTAALTTNLVWRVNDGPWLTVAGSVDLHTGVFLVEVGTSTTGRRVEFALELDTTPGVDVTSTRAVMSYTAFHVE